MVIDVVLACGRRQQNSKFSGYDDDDGCRADHGMAERSETDRIGFWIDFKQTDRIKSKRIGLQANGSDFKQTDRIISKRTES
jgi:hypothetical protein